MRAAYRSIAYIGLAVAAISLAGLAAEPREAEAEAQHADPPQVAALAEAAEIVETVEAVGPDPACSGAVWPYVDPACLEGAAEGRPVTRVLRADGDLRNRRAAELRRLAGGR